MQSLHTLPLLGVATCIAVARRGTAVSYARTQHPSPDTLSALKPLLTSPYSSPLFTAEYNEKAFLDIATPDEMFEWMKGPLLEGLYPDSLYNGLPVPPELQGYVMVYNKVVGKIRLRQLRVEPGEGCSLPSSTIQSGVTETNEDRQRHFVDACFPPYSEATKSIAPFGPGIALAAANPSTATTDVCETDENGNTVLANCVNPGAPFVGNGFTWTNETSNKLTTRISGEVATYDGSGFVRDLDGRNRTAYEEAIDEVSA